MVDLARVRKGLKNAYDKIRSNPVSSAAVSTALGFFIPSPFGNFLQKVWDNASGSSDDKTNVILELLGNLQKYDDKELQQLSDIQQELRVNQNTLKDLVASSTTVVKTLEELKTGQITLEESNRRIEEAIRILPRIEKEIQAIPQQVVEILLKDGLVGQAGPTTPAQFGEALDRLRQAPLEGIGLIAKVKVGGNPACVICSPTKAEVYVSNLGSDSVSIIDTSALEEALSRNAPLEEVPDIDARPQPASLAISPDGKLLYVGNNGGGVNVIDLDSRQRLRTIPTPENPRKPGTPSPVRDLAITRDGKIYLALEYSGLGRLDPGTNEVTIVDPTPCPEGVAVTPHGHNLYVSYQCKGPGGTLGHDAIGVFDTKSDTPLQPIKGSPDAPLPNVGGAIEVSPDGLQVWVNGLNACIAESYKPHEGCPFVPGGIINVIDTRTNKPIKSLGIPTEYGVGFISFLENGRKAIVGGNNLKLFDTTTFRISQVIDIPLSGSTAVFGDRKYLYAPAPTQNLVILLEIIANIAAEAL